MERIPSITSPLDEDQESTGRPTGGSLIGIYGATMVDGFNPSLWKAKDSAWENNILRDVSDWSWGKKMLECFPT